MKKHSKTANKEGGKNQPDLTGQDRFRSNLLHSWGGYLIVFVAGFLSPRLIDQNLGQMELGIWDFSWTFMNYMKLAMLGIGSSINRYVANYRAAGDIVRLNRTVSTVVCMQAAIAFLILLLSVLLCWQTPTLFGSQLGEYTETARWTVLLLGISVSINMAFDTSRGVITGCHRWDLHNRIETVANLMELAGMVTILSLGGGLCSLGTVVLFVALIAGLWRMFSVPRICPELHVSLSMFRWSAAQEMLRFGLKTFAIRSPLLILVQTTNLLIASHLGPASLAVFSRSLALVRHTEGFMSKFAFILAPTAGALQGQDKEADLRRFFLNTTRYGVAFASPMLFFLIIDGDLILRIWMGERYVHGPVLAILAIGYFLPISQNSVREILKGMNAHGKIGLFCFCLTGICFLTGYIIFKQTDWTLNSAAILLAVSLGVGLGIPPPVYACIKLKTSLTHYVLHSLLPPMLCNSVFVASLLAGRYLFPNNAFIAVGVGGSVGVLLLAPLYLYFVFPEQRPKIWLKVKEKLNWN